MENLKEKVLFSSNKETDIIICGNLFDFDPDPDVTITSGDYDFHVTINGQKKKLFHCGESIQITKLKTFLEEDEDFDEDGGFSYVLIKDFKGDLKLRVNVENIGYVDTNTIGDYEYIRYDFIDEKYSDEYDFDVELDINNGEVFNLDLNLYNEIK